MYVRRPDFTYVEIPHRIHVIAGQSLARDVVTQNGVKWLRIKTKDIHIQYMYILYPRNYKWYKVAAAYCTTTVHKITRRRSRSQHNRSICRPSRFIETKRAARRVFQIEGVREIMGFSGISKFFFLTFCIPTKQKQFEEEPSLTRVNESALVGRVAMYLVLFECTLVSVRKTVFTFQQWRGEDLEDRSPQLTF